MPLLGYVNDSEESGCAVTQRISMSICSANSNQNHSNANVSRTHDGAFNLMLLFSSLEAHSVALPLLK